MISDTRTHTFPWPAEIYAEALGGVDKTRVFSRSPSVRLFRETLARHARPGMAVLDIGCGVAIGACHLAALGAFDIAYTGIDIEPRVCERARAILAGLPHDRIRGDVVCADIGALPPGWTSQFDLALWNYSLHACLEAEDARAGLVEGVTAALRPGGVLIVGDAFVDEGTAPEEVQRIHAYATRAAAGLCTGVHRDPGSVRPLQMESIFGHAGLHLLESRDVPWFALSTYQGMPHARYALRVFARPRGEPR